VDQRLDRGDEVEVGSGDPAGEAREQAPRAAAAGGGGRGDAVGPLAIGVDSPAPEPAPARGERGARRRHVDQEANSEREPEREREARQAQGNPEQLQQVAEELDRQQAAAEGQEQQPADEAPDPGPEEQRLKSVEAPEVEFAPVIDAVEEVGERLVRAQQRIPADEVTQAGDVRELDLVVGDRVAQIPELDRPTRESDVEQPLRDRAPRRALRLTPVREPGLLERRVDASR